MILGILTNFVLFGISGGFNSIFATLLPVILLFVLYALRMLGAGDIKLFSAIGAVMGLEFVLYTLAFSFISGGIIAILLMAIRKNGRTRLLYLGHYLKKCFLTFSLLPYSDFQDKSDGSKFRFAYAVTCGTILAITFKTMFLI